MLTPWLLSLSGARVSAGSLAVVRSILCHKFCMAGYLTPKSMAASSVFLTPPNSLEKEDDELSVPLSPLPFPSLFTPPHDAHSQEDTSRDDFIALWRLRFPLIVQKILDHLTGPDLVECLSVSRTWRSTIKARPGLMQIVSEYQKGRKENAENLNKTAVSERETRSRVRPSLTDLSNRLPNPPLTPLVQGTSTITGDRLRPCPNCQSPAKRMDQNRALCDHCEYNFCMICLRENHKGECRGSSPKRSFSSIAVAGTKKSRKRLKRL